MAKERLLTDLRVRGASKERDGAYLRDGGGLRIRLLPASTRHPKGAKLAEYHYSLKAADGSIKQAALHLGTIGDTFTDPAGKLRPFTLSDARVSRDEARELVSRGIDPREARRLAQQEAVEEQRQRLAELDGQRTVRDAFKQWRELYLSAHRKDGGEWVQDLFDRDVLPVVGDDTLASLRRSRVTEVLDRIVARGARRTANEALALLRQFMHWCIARDWLQIDPTTGLKKANVGGRDKPRERTLSPLEIVELRDKLPASGLPLRLRHAVWLILATGCRVGEISAARVSDFDLDANLWRIPTTKNGKPHVVQLSDFAVEHLGALLTLRGKSQWLLPAKTPVLDAKADDEDDDEPVDDSRPVSDKIIAKLVGDRQREVALKGRAKATGALLLAQGKWTPHDLRRTMATRMRELGVSSDVIERCLNHTPQGIVAVYQRGDLMPDRQRAFEAWGKELERLMQVDRTNVVQLPANTTLEAA